MRGIALLGFHGLFIEISPFLMSLGALLFLQDGDWWIAGKKQIMERSIEALELDGELFEKLFAFYRQELHPNPEQTRALYDNFMGMVEQAADIVDQLEQE